MYETRWAERNEMNVISIYWYQMALETSVMDGIPRPDESSIKEKEDLFLKEFDANNLLFRVATDPSGAIVSCAGGILRYEFSTPLSTEQSLFGWIVGVYTHKKHRRRGLGTIMVNDICDWLKESGAKRARLWSSSQGRSVYKNLGFKEIMDLEKSLT